MILNDVQIEERCKAHATKVAECMVADYIGTVKHYMNREGGVKEMLNVASDDKEVSTLIEEDFAAWLEGYQFRSGEEKPSEEGKFEDSRSGMDDA